eukprot:scaffold20253_cov18-Tisochrysis_lutea.AAC.2
MTSPKVTEEVLDKIEPKEVPASRCTHLERDNMRKGQTRDMDTLFHNRLSQLEESLGDVKTEVQLAVADVLEGVGKKGDRHKLVFVEVKQGWHRCKKRRELGFLQAIHGL